MRYLVGTSGVHIRQEIPLDGEVIIGRDASICQLVYPSTDKGVSGVHCKVKCIGGVVQIQDMGSTNGTFLDSGIRLTPNVPQIIEAGQGFYLADRGNAYVIKEVDESGKSQQKSAAEAGQGTQSGTVTSTNTGTRNGSIGFSIASFVVGIVAIIAGIASFFFPSFFYPAIILGVVGLGLGITALMTKCRSLAMTIVGIVCSTLTVIGLIGFMLFSMYQPKTVVGTWAISDSTEVKAALRAAIGDGMKEMEMDPRMADVLIEATDMATEIMFTFSDSGNLYIGNAAGINYVLGVITWEDTQDDYLRLAIDLKDVEIFGASVPVEIGYRAKYEIKGDEMTLDFFGAKVKLEKQKEGLTDEKSLFGW